MHKKGRFHKIEMSDELMYGPRGLVICGFLIDERDALIEMAEKTLGKIPVIFGVNRDVDVLLGEIFGYNHQDGLTEPSDLPRAIIMSGLSRNELHSWMAACREAGLKGHIWATLTPTSKGWTLKALLKELLAEAKAMRRQ